MTEPTLICKSFGWRMHEHEGTIMECQSRFMTLCTRAVHVACCVCPCLRSVVDKELPWSALCHLWCVGGSVRELSR